MYNIYGITDIGKSRDHNEDHLCINKSIVGEGEIFIEDSTFFAAVADGLGGLAKGEVASRFVLDKLCQLEEPYSIPTFEDFIVSLDKMLLDLGKERGLQNKMGTTLCGVTCEEERYIVFHVGDSRLYRYREGFLKQITKDHSLVQTLFETGEITKEEMQTHPQRNIILQCIGTGSKRGLKPEVFQLRGGMKRGDILLLCTDGLTSMVKDDEIEEILKEKQSLQEAVKQMVILANNYGGEDNITIIAVEKVE